MHHQLIQIGGRRGAARMERAPFAQHPRQALERAGITTRNAPVRLMIGRGDKRMAYEAIILAD